MIFPDSFTASGSLLKLEGDNNEAWLRSLANVEQEEAGVRGWHRLLWVVKEPLAGEIAVGGETFSYPLLFRGSKEREHAFLLGHHGTIIEIFLKRYPGGARVSCPAVDIPRLVEDLVARPVEYLMSAIHARVEGEGQSLRTLALYGSDVGDAQILTNLLPALQAYRVTLRRIDTGKEALSIGSRGEASFLYRGRASLRGVDTVLRFLAENRYIDWSRALPVSLR
jgi:hypothetical protein